MKIFSLPFTHYGYMPLFSKKCKINALIIEASVSISFGPIFALIYY